MTLHSFRSPDGLPSGRTLPESEGGLRAPPGLGPWARVWWWLKFWLFVKTARLRFLAILVAIGLVIVKWDLLKAYYGRARRPDSGHAARRPDTELSCPMHPPLIRAH